LGFYTGKKVVVTGGLGFLGRNVIDLLIEDGADVTAVTRSDQKSTDRDFKVVNADLRIISEAENAVKGADHVFHLAAHGFGIGANISVHPELLTSNLSMSLNTLEAARRASVERYLYCSSSSVYNAEHDLLDDTVAWDGEPHPSEHGFGWAKRTAEIQAKTFAEHTDMKIAIVRPSNPYGIHDLFDSAKSHVIPAMMLRALDRENPFSVWGSGKAVRSFVYSKDAAQAILLAGERIVDGDSVNIASPTRTTIGELAGLLLDACDASDLPIEFDTSKPEGHPGRFPTTSKATRLLGWTAETSLTDGLKKTVDWYNETQRRN
jgi:GDP-L-fucose synthase